MTEDERKEELAFCKAMLEQVNNQIAFIEKLTKRINGLGNQIEKSQADTKNE